MGRRRKFRFKHSTRRRVWSKEKGSDGSDEDYKVGRDEELDESDEYYSLDGDESEDSSGEFEEANEMKVKKVSRSRGKRSFRTRKANGFNKPRKQKRITYKQELDGDDDYDDDDDEEFSPDEIDSIEDEDEMTEKKKVSNGVAKGRIGKRKTKRNTKLLRKPIRKKSRRKKSRTVKRTQSSKVTVEEEKSKKKPGKRKRMLMADSNSDSTSSGSSDYEFTISEEEREQVREASKFCTSLAISLRSSSSSSKRLLKQEVSSHKRIDQGRKGKEKLEDLRNQVCGICLSEEQKRTVRGTLNCCSHYFCFPCIMEWSKVESRCPLCKQRFTTISKPARSNTGFDLRTVSIRVPERNQVYQPSEEELSGYVNPYESVICTECQQGGDDALTLLCDLCDSPAHTYCVGLGREVPEGNWYCEACRPATLNTQSPNSTPIQNSSASLSGQDLNSIYVPDTPFTQETGPSSSLRDFRPASPTSPAFTVLDRRRIQSQIRVIINNRASSSSGRSNGISATNLRIRSLGSQLDQTSTPPPQRVSPFSEIRVQDSSPPLGRNRDRISSRTSEFRGQIQNPTSINGGGMLQARNEVVNVGSDPSFLLHNPCGSRLNIGSDASHLNVEKEQVQQMVQKHLKALSSGNELGYQTFKEIARSSTHTILAVCGLEHRANEVYPVQPPPSLCNHAEQPSCSRSSFMKDFCSDCFDSFVGYVVKMIASARTSPTIRV